MRHTSKRGKRGGRNASFSGEVRRDIHSRIDGLPSAHHAGHSHNINSNKSVTAATMESGKYRELAVDVEETREDYCIPRRSLSQRQGLALTTQIETESRVTRQLNKRRYDGKATTVEEAIAKQGLIETTDQRLTWRSDRTLLAPGNPFRDAESGNRAGYKREGSTSVGLNTQKHTRAIPNADPEPEKVLGIAYDGPDLFSKPEAVEITESDILKALGIEE